MQSAAISIGGLVPWSAVPTSFAWGDIWNLISIMFLGTTFGYFGLAGNTAAITVIAFRVAKDRFP